MNIEKVFDDIIPNEKQIEIELEVKNYLAEGQFRRKEAIEAITDAQTVKDSDSFGTEETEKEKQRTSTQKTERVKEIEMPVFPDNPHLIPYLSKQFTRKLKGLLSDVAEKLFLCCITKSYKPLNKQWIINIKEIKEIGDIAKQQLMVQRTLRTGGRILVPEWRERLESVKVIVQIANLRFPKKGYKQLWDSVIAWMPLIPFGPKGFARISNIKVT